MNKRGAYFFVIDAFIAASIILLSLIIIFTSHNMVPESSPTLRIITDYTRYLMNTRIREFPIQGGYVTSLENNKNITNLDNTLLDQLAEFYYRNMTGESTANIMYNFTREISKAVIPAQRGYAILLCDPQVSCAPENKTLIYNWTPREMQESHLMLSSQKIAFKRINESYIYGPIILEVRIWI